MLSPTERLSYAARQGARVAWYMGHYFASQRFRRANPEAGEEERPRRRGPSRDTILAEMGKLFARDLTNVERGYYPLPRDHDGDLSEAIATSRRFFADLPLAAERKELGRADEVAHEPPQAPVGHPDYFLRVVADENDGESLSRQVRDDAMDL